MKIKRIKPMNNKGAIGIIIFFAILMIALVLGFIAVISLSVIDIASDELTPIMTDLGMAGDSNISEYAEYSFGTANTFIQALPWMVTIGYVMILVFTLVFVFVVEYNPHPAFLSLYIALMVLLIFLCIIMSNMYQDIYTGTDDLATRLQDQVAMSYLILYSPFITTFIAMIGGILMFARQSSSEGGGGYGI